MEQLVRIVNDIIWSPVLPALLLGAGLYFTIRTRFVQIRRFGLMARLLFGKDAPKSGENRSLSSFQAFCLALSGRVGTGNIVGVATAIAIGGPGSIFWMWVVAFVGASTAFTESTLAQLYKFKNSEGEYRGGPASYIEKGLNQPFLGILFAIFIILGYGMLLVLVQANGVSTAFHTAFGLSPWIPGMVMAVLLGLVIIGGIKRIGRVAMTVTPAMAIFYVILSIVILGANVEKIPGVLKLIFDNAFAINPMVGGILGTTIEMGVKRGLFSNEAGQGGGAIVSASADVDMPAKQGLVQGFSVYIDTLFICTATALMILCTGSYNIVEGGTGNILHAVNPVLGNNYVSFTQTAVDSVFPGLGSGFVSIALFLFAFTTVMAFAFYAESNITYLFQKGPQKLRKAKNITVTTHRIILLSLILYGAVSTADTAWMIGDIGLGLTTYLNVIALLILFPKALKALKECEDKYPVRRK